MRSPAPLTVPLRAIRGADQPAVGGKAANLGELRAAGLPVPEGFCVTTAAFDRFLAGSPSRLPALIRLASHPAPVENRTEEASRGVRACLAEVEFPEAVKAAVLAAWSEARVERSFAVRSSATVEDALDHSFAGQFESVLNVRGVEALLEAVKRCWLSLFSERALAYMRRNAIPLERVRMAVVVQEMVDAEWSGVVFTADPMTGAGDKLVVECVPGLGEPLVQGTVSPQRHVLEKSTRVTCETYPAGDLLPELLLEKLLNLARATETLFGTPQDIEWAAAGDAVYLLQARPIPNRTLAKTWEERQVWTNLNTGEVMPDVMTPITWSMIHGLLDCLVRRVFRLHGVEVSEQSLVGRVAGRIYFNANTALAALRPFSFLFERIPNMAQALGGAQTEASRELLRNIPEEDLPNLGFTWTKYVLSWPRLLRDLIRHSPRRGDAWTQRIKARNDELVRLDVASFSMPELIQCYNRLLHESFEGWDLLYLITQAVALPVFQDACRYWLDDPDLTLGYRLFAGQGGVAEAEACLALWRLAALAHTDVETEAAVISSDSWPVALTKLGKTEHGRTLVNAWHAFMSEHGHHCRGELELFNARWAEQPDYILGLVRGYLRSVDQTNPLERQQRLTEERVRLTEQCRRRLRNPIKRWIFSRSLRRAQRLAINREEWKNQAVRQIAALRRVLLTLGRQLHDQGVLSSCDDVFFLEVPEVEPVATGRADFNAQERIASRRREYETNLTLSPPPVVVGKFRPAPTPVTTPEVSSTFLKGIPVSPGVATGRARVILRCDNHQQVLPGEVLVAPFTDPAWTPYFLTAAGVVMDQGGILSHGSIVAREYGLPAVTNVGSATRMIQTGDLVEVDGNQGRVTVLKRATGC